MTTEEICTIGEEIQDLLSAKNMTSGDAVICLGSVISYMLAGKCKIIYRSSQTITIPQHSTSSI